MPPHKQPLRCDLLCAARFGRHLYETRMTIQQLIQVGLSRQANLLWEQEKLLCAGLPARLVDRYLVQMFRDIYFEPVKYNEYPAIRTILECLLKTDSRNLDMSWVTDMLDDSVPVDPQSLTALVPSLGNLRVVILRENATDEVLRLLCRHCEHLEELDVSDSDISDYGLSLFGVADQRGVHGCPNLVRLRLRGCFGICVTVVARLLKDLKNLEKLPFNKMTDVLLELFETHLCRLRDEPADAAGYPFPVFRLKELSLRLHALTAQRVSTVFSRVLTHEEYRYRSGTDPLPPPPRGPHFEATHTDGFLDFIAYSFPWVETVQLESYSRVSSLVTLQRFLRLRKLTLFVRPAVNLKEVFALCINSNLTSLELNTRDLPADALVAIGTTCERLKELKITLSVKTQLGETFPTHKKGVFGNLEVLHYKTAGSIAVSEDELLYLMSGATNLVNLGIVGNVDFLTDLFWVNFLTYVNQLKRLEILLISSSKTSPRSFSMGKVSVYEFLRNCPDLKTFLGSFDPVLLSDDEIKKIQGEMESKNFDFVLRRL